MVKEQQGRKLRKIGEQFEHGVEGWNELKVKGKRIYCVENPKCQKTTKNGAKMTEKDGGGTLTKKQANKQSVRLDLMKTMAKIE